MQLRISSTVRVLVALVVAISAIGILSMGSLNLFFDQAASPPPPVTSPVPYGAQSEGGFQPQVDPTSSALPGGSYDDYEEDESGRYWTGVVLISAGVLLAAAAVLVVNATLGAVLGTLGITGIILGYSDGALIEFLISIGINALVLILLAEYVKKPSWLLKPYASAVLIIAACTSLAVQLVVLPASLQIY